MRTRPVAALLAAAAVLLAADPAGVRAAGPPAGDLPAVEPAAPDAGRWRAPLDGGVTRRFDVPDGPYRAGHRGVDLAGFPAAPVLAAGDGVVVFAGRVAGRPVVSVDHEGGLRTTYEPVDAAVGAGRQVARGTVLGTLVGGHAGCPVPACLHWGLRRGERYLDPLVLLRLPQVRLLPLGLPPPAAPPVPRRRIRRRAGRPARPPPGATRRRGR